MVVVVDVVVVDVVVVDVVVDSVVVVAGSVVVVVIGSVVVVDVGSADVVVTSTVVSGSLVELSPAATYEPCSTVPASTTVSGATTHAKRHENPAHCLTSAFSLQARDADGEERLPAVKAVETRRDPAAVIC